MKRFLCGVMSLILILCVFSVAVNAMEETTLPVQEEQTTVEVTEPTTEEANKDTTTEEPTTEEPTTEEPTTEPVAPPSTYETWLSLKAVVKGVSVEWRCDGEADYYNVYRRKAGESQSKLIATVTSKVYVDEAVVNNTYYKYYVESIVDGEVRGISDAILTRYLAAPKNLKAVISTGIFGKQVDISWSAVEGATRYDIYCRVAGQTEYKKIAYMSYKYTSANLNTVQSGYVRYAVVAVCGDYIGALDTNGPLTKNFEKIEVDFSWGYLRDNGIMINWYGDTNTTGYRIYRRAGGEKYYTYLETVPSKGNGSHYYVDKTVQSGKYYKYIVRAVYGTVFGPYDDSGKVVQYVAKPKLLGIANATDGVYVKWEPVAGAKEYIIYKRGAGEGFQPYKTVKASAGNRIKDIEAVPLQYYAYTVAAVSQYNENTEYDKSGLVIKHTPLGTTWNTVSIIKYNNFHTSKTYNDVKEYKLEYWQKLDSQKVTGDNKRFVSEFDKTMRNMFNYPVNTVINESPELQDFYPGGVLWDSVKSAKMKSDGNYYTITIVLKDQTSPEKDESCAINWASHNYMDFQGIVSGLGDEHLISYGRANSLYKNFTIVSTFTKDGKLVSVTHSCENVTASMDLTFVSGIGKVKYNAQFDTYLRYTNFKYE